MKAAENYETMAVGCLGKCRKCESYDACEVSCFVSEVGSCNNCPLFGEGCERNPETKDFYTPIERACFENAKMIIIAKYRTEIDALAAQLVNQYGCAMGDIEKYIDGEL